MKTNRDKFLVILLGIVFLVFIYLLATFEPEPSPNINKPYQFLYEQLNNENQLLQLEINQLKTEFKNQQKKIDSLELIKQKIKVVYVNKIKEVDSSNVNGVINDFKNILSKGNY